MQQMTSNSKEVTDFLRLALISRTLQTYLFQAFPIQQVFVVMKSMVRLEQLERIITNSCFLQC